MLEAGVLLGCKIIYYKLNTITDTSCKLKYGILSTYGF